MVCAVCGCQRPVATYTWAGKLRRKLVGSSHELQALAAPSMRARVGDVLLGHPCNSDVVGAYKPGAARGGWGRGRAPASGAAPHSRVLSRVVLSASSGRRRRRADAQLLRMSRACGGPGCCIGGARRSTLAATLRGLETTHRRRRQGLALSRTECVVPHQCCKRLRLAASTRRCALDCGARRV